MKEFEAFWSDADKPYEYYERYVENGETKTAKIPLESECYIQNPNGEYKFILDKSIKLQKVLKKNTKGLKTYGTNNVGLEWIRQKYWTFEKSYYNMSPRLWALDIETTAFGPIDTINCPETIVSIQVFDAILKTNFIFALEDFDVAKHTSTNGNYEFDGREYPFKLKYYKLKSEEDLLKALFLLIKQLKPLVVAAHNGEGFDFAYLWKRAQLYKIEGFSPFGASKYKMVENKEGNKLTHKIIGAGVFYMDSIALYKKFGEDTRTSASYSLDSLASKILGENKVEHDCFSSFDGFRTGTNYIVPESCPPETSTFEFKLYNAYKTGNNDEFVKISKEYFIHYSIIDTYLLFEILDKMKIMDIMVGIAATMGTQLDQTLGVITPWSIYMRNYALTRNLVMPEQDANDAYEEFKGAFVKDPRAGKYGWTYSVDVTSMYPSQIMAFNISSDTFVPKNQIPLEIRQKALELGLSEDEEYHLKKYKENPKPYLEYAALLKKHNLCGSLIGTCFRKDEVGILPDLVEKVFKARKADKAKMLEYERLYEKTKDPKHAELIKAYDNLQLTKKILIVGVYGANGNPYFILFNPKISASITANSRFYVNLFSANVNEFMQKSTNEHRDLLVYNDTDSTGKDTLININGSEMTIENFYNLVSNEEQTLRENHFIKSTENLNFKTASVSQDLKIENKKIKYVMKHKVKKEMFRISVNGKYVDITADHSLMVVRNNKLISVKPKEIQKGDKVLLNE